MSDLARYREAMPWVRRLVSRRRLSWGWSYLGAVAMWLVVTIGVGRGGTGTLVEAAMVGSFYFVAGSGQMFVIALGNGNVDLSIPYTMTVSGVVAVDVMNGTNVGMVPGLLLGLAVGLAVGMINVFVVRVIRVEPIIGTLAVGFILESVAVRLTNAIFPPQPSPDLTSFTVMKVVGVPVMPVVFVAAAVLLALVSGRSLFGWGVTGYGQRAEAAILAKLPVRLAIAGAYLLSGLFAGLAGVLFAAYSGGASLDASAPFLLGSIAVVVLGGSSIAGGEMSFAGVWGGALFLTLISTAVTALGLSASWQDIVEGFVIVLALSIQGQRGNARG
jgi:ribose transport system permease protein